MRAYSIDLRQRIVDAVEDGIPPRLVAQQFRVSLRTVNRYLHLARTTGNLRPRTASGRQRFLTPDHEAHLLRLLHDDPAATLPQLCVRLAEATGLTVSRFTIARTITRLGWSRKKERWQPANATPRSGLSGNASSNASQRT